MEIESLRKFCLSLKGTTEDIKWEQDLCFSIGGKMYCVTGFEKPIKISLKADAEEFETLIQTPGIIPAPYLARHKWVLIEDATRFNKKEMERLIGNSFELIKGKLPKKILKNLDVAE